jgi:hypothetical protein
VGVFYSTKAELIIYSILIILIRLIYIYLFSPPYGGRTEEGVLLNSTPPSSHPLIVEGSHAEIVYEKI